MIGFGLLVALALAPAGTTTGRWVSMGTDEYGITWWLDAYSAGERGKSSTPWFKQTYSKPQARGLKETLLRVSIRCEERQYAILDTVRYYQGGFSESDPSTDERIARFEAPPPDSVAEHLVNTLCDKN